jgi:hypothetical protein
MHRFRVKGPSVLSTINDPHLARSRLGKERLITLDFVVQGLTSDGCTVLTGSLPPMGFGGALAVETRGGRVVGLLVGRAEGQFEHLNETYVAPVSELLQRLR